MHQHDDQAKAWVTLMKEADDGDGTLTYEAGNDDSLMMIMIMFAAPLRMCCLFVGKDFL